MEIPIKQNESLFEALEKIKKSEHNSITLVIEKGSGIFKSKINLLLLFGFAKRNEKDVILKTEDSAGKNLIDSVSGKKGGSVKNDKDFDVRKARVEKAELKAQPPFNHILPKLSSARFVARLLFYSLIVAVLLSAAFFMWWFIPFSNVELVMDSDVLVKSIELRADPNINSPSSEKKAIPATWLSVEKSDTKSVETTGSSVIGDKAKGTVDIINKTDSEKSFDRGSVIYLGSDLNIKYVLLEDVKVPKKEVTSSSEVSETVTFGKASAQIEAEDIGSEYNVEEGVEFGIEGEDSDQVYAKSSTSVDGGFSKEVKAVAQIDKSKLSESTLESIKKDALSALKDKLVGDQVLPEGGVEYTLVQESFDKEVGEQGEFLNLTQTVRARGIVYSSKKMSDLLESILREFVPEKYEVFGDGGSVEVSQAIVSRVEEEGNGGEDTAVLQVKVKSYVIPKVDVAKVIEDIAGQGMGYTQDYLSQIPYISSFTIDISPPLPEAIRTMPHRRDRIVIKVTHK